MTAISTFPSSVRRFFTTAFQKALGVLQDADKMVLLGQLTLLMFVLYGPFNWFATPVYQIILLLSLIFPKVITSPITWVSIALVTGLSNFATWTSTDNHMWVMLYWSLSFFIATVIYAKSREKARMLLRHNAIFMLVVIMGFSVVQKILSGDYLNGAFFEFALLTDHRFFLLSHYIGGLPVSDFYSNIQMFQRDISTEFVLVGTATISKLALLVTYFVLIIEALIAGLLLLKKQKYQTAAHICNFIFIAGVYIFAPVYAFGFLISILGISALKGNSPRFTLIYIVLIMLIILYDKVPWFSLFYLATN